MCIKVDALAQCQDLFVKLLAGQVLGAGVQFLQLWLRNLQVLPKLLLTSEPLRQGINKCLVGERIGNGLRLFKVLWLSLARGRKRRCPSHSRRSTSTNTNQHSAQQHSQLPNREGVEERRRRKKGEMMARRDGGGNCRIQRLPKATVDVLQAGKTIVDLAQAVEELVLNAIDAEASKIDVTVNPQHNQIIVRDNGVGIAFHDLELLAQPHCTSKISSMADLASIKVQEKKGKERGERGRRERGEREGG